MSASDAGSVLRKVFRSSVRFAVGIFWDVLGQTATRNSQRSGAASRAPELSGEPRGAKVSADVGLKLGFLSAGRGVEAF
jgi:hypothetical protein